jgi:hypothetical protein
MDEGMLRILVRVGMIVAGVAMLGLVTLVTRKRRPETAERTQPLTAFSGRRGPLLAIGFAGAVVASIGQWLRGGSISDSPSTPRLI